ncbi:MAG: glycoside hydrolase family 127 protein [Chitinophagaceae bacterium]|nr:glycoside hydrolase family 127 protein [Chitinophagaceae bacterium]
MNKEISILIIVLLGSILSYSQIPMNGSWAYSLKDDSTYASPSFDDSGWEKKESGKLKWQELPKGSNIVWIRKKVVIPSSLKQELLKTGGMMLYLGRIKQEDKLYFNGKLAGETNSGDIKRAYVLKPKDIIWDQENTVAIRISHWGGSASVDEPPIIKAAGPDQLFILDAAAEGVTAKQQVKDKSAVYNSIIRNQANKSTSAILIVDFYDLDSKKLKSEQKNIVLKPGENRFSFPFKSPVSFLKVSYNLSIPSYSYKKVWNQEYGYITFDYKPARVVEDYKTSEIFSSAALEQQTIQGWLGQRLDANRLLRLHKVDEPALLAGFINKPGAHPWIGEHIGKFLEAACNTYLNTKDPELRIQIDRSAQQLIASQLNDGYLGTYDMASQWTSWDVWSHKYDLIGLLSYYEISGYKPALDACEKIGNLLVRRFGDKPGQLDIIKAGTHVGMAATSVLDPMTDLYRFSGKKEYLDFCYYITESFNNKNGPRIIATLDSIGRVDKTANSKAYEMLSNLVGLVKLYRITEDVKFLKPVSAAWQDIAGKRLYITGTTSSFEHFQDDHKLPASKKDNMGEGCVTTTWIQLNYQLLSISGDMKYLNELERAVYNHLTGAENPQTGCVSYYTPLMGDKPYRCVITCCMSSIPRGIAMIPLFTNGSIKGSPSFLFYQPGVYKTTVNNKTAVEFTTRTTFPEEGAVTIEVDPAAEEKFEVLLRKPYWAANFKIAINGTEQALTTDSLTAISRVWRKGDKIDVSFTMPVTLLDGGISYPGSIAFQRGPQVLVVDGKLNPSLADSFTVPAEDHQLRAATGILPDKWVGTQAYKIKAEVNGKNEDIVLVPYADASQTGGVVTTWMKKK